MSGRSTTISATDTPNLSNQVDTNAYEWDLDGDGIYELTGPSTDVFGKSEGTFPISLRVNGVDGQNPHEHTLNSGHRSILPGCGHQR